MLDIHHNDNSEITTQTKAVTISALKELQVHCSQWNLTESLILKSIPWIKATGRPYISLSSIVSICKPSSMERTRLQAEMQFK